MKTLTAVSLPTEQATAEEVLAWGLREFGDRIALCTGFQAEGMVLLHMASRLAPEGFRIVTLDTGRLPEETHELMAEVRRRYRVTIETVYPDKAEVEEMTTRHGSNLFYDAVAKRRLCCEVRKVRPLARKLAQLDAWIVGVRRDQNETRRDVSKAGIDSANGGIVKLSPLADWTTQQIEEYSERHHLPRHKLYDRGYTSIGCAPCSRAVEPGEDQRAGRWWWEYQAAKECGIHFSGDGSVRREMDVLLEDILHPAQ